MTQNMTQVWDDLQGRLRSGGLNRRQFIAGAAALGITGSLVDKALAQTPKRGGHLIVGITQGASDDSMDPAKWSNSSVYTLGYQLHDTLTFANPKYQLEPALAESWESNASATEWVFKLRKGVTFHNGKTFTSADAAFSLNLHRTATSMGRAMVAGIKDVKATGPNEITVSLNAGNSDFPFFLSEFHMVIVPEDSKLNGVGTGPYTLESFEPGVRAVTKRYANDWNQNRGFVASIETLHIGDQTARISAVLSGAANLVDRVPSAMVPTLEGKAQVFSTPSATHPVLTMGCDKAPFADNPDLRRALKHAIDREQLLKIGFRGQGTIANDHPVPEGMAMYAADIPQHKYDPEKVKFYMKKSGYSGPIVLAASDGAFQNGIAVAELFASSAKAAGIDFQIKPLPASGYFTQYMDNNFFQSTFGGRPTADLMLSTEFGAKSPINESRWSNPQFEQLLLAARSESDVAKRKQMYHDLQFIAHDEAGSIIPIYTNIVDAGTKNVRGYVGSPIQAIGAWRATQQVWLDDA